MSDEKKLPPGSTLNVTLRRKQKRQPPARPVAADHIATDGEGSQGGRGIVPLDDDGPQLYVRRGGKSALSFFDLGTRLRSVPAGFSPLEFRPSDATDTPTPHEGHFNEYVEIETHFAGIYTEAGATRALTLTSDEHAAYTHALLGSLAPGDPAPVDPLNPFGSSPANVTARSLPHCENLAYDSLTLFQMIVRVGTKPALDFSATFKFREETDPDASEQWNPLNLEGFPTPHEGLLEAKDARGTLKVETGAFREFDTGDSVNFKVTSAASFADEEAEFTLSTKPVSVYLVPALSAYQLTTGGADNEPVAQLATRAHSSYPYGTEANGGDVTGCLLRRTPLAAFVGGAGSYLRPELTNPAPAGSLVAVIVRDGARFFVWRRTDAPGVPQAAGGTLPDCDY
jgi:hypothetical protein